MVGQIIPGSLWTRFLPGLMGPVVALFFALAAVQAVPIQNINEIDIFYPIQNEDFSLDRFGRAYSHYYHWSNPIFGYNQRFFWPGFSPMNPEYRMQQQSHNYLYNRYNQYFRRNHMSVQDLFERPVIVVTPSAQEQNSFAAFFLHSGLRSLFRYKSFSSLQQYLMSPSLKGLVFYPHNMYNIRFYEMPVSSITVPEHFRMSEFLDSVDYPESIPILFIAPEQLFAEMHFDNIAKVTDFRIYKDVIEVVPSSYPLPQSQLQQIFSHQHGNKNQQNQIHHHQESQSNNQQIAPISPNHLASNDVFRADVLATPYGMYDGNVYGYQAQDLSRYQQPQQLFGIHGYGDNSQQGSMFAVNGMTQNHLGKVVGLHANSMGITNNQLQMTPAISSNQQTIVNTDTSRLLVNPVPIVSTERHSELHTLSGDHQMNPAIPNNHQTIVNTDTSRLLVNPVPIVSTERHTELHTVSGDHQMSPAIQSNQQTIVNTDTSRLLVNPVPVVSTERHSELHTVPGNQQNVATLSASAAPALSDVENSNVVKTTITKTVTTSSIHPQMTGAVETHTTFEKTLNEPQVETIVRPAALQHQKETHYETVVYPGKSVETQSSRVIEMNAGTGSHSGAESQNQHSSFLGSLKSTGQNLVSRISNLPVVSSVGNLQGSVGLHAGAQLGGSGQSSIVTKESSTVSKSEGSLLGGLLGGVSGGLSVHGNAGLNAGSQQQLGGDLVSRTTVTKETHSSSQTPLGGLNFSFGIGADAQGKSLLNAGKENHMQFDEKLAGTMMNEGSLSKNLDIRAATNEMRMR